MDPKQATPESKSSTQPAKKYQLKPWKIALMVFAALLLVVGVTLGLTQKGTDSRSGGGSGNVMVSNFDGKQTGGGDASAQEPSVDWAGALTRGGISFFAAFCLAFAFRTFMRLAIIFIGVWVASLFLLSHLGWVEVHWDLIDSQFKGGVGHLKEQFASLEHFVTGSLPSASLAGLGIFTGLKTR